jgi:hypothetical protein
LHSIFPPLRGKYYNKKLSDLCGSRDLKGTGGDIILACEAAD